MVQTQFEVQTYRVVLAGRMAVEAMPLKFRAYIVCEGPDGEVATFYFVDDAEVPPNFYDPERKLAVAYLPSAQYPWYVDILRNEGPLLIALDSERPELNRLATGPEPAGEGEMLLRLLQEQAETAKGGRMPPRIVERVRKA
jgi:hypothetical protein